MPAFGKTQEFGSAQFTAALLPFLVGGTGETEKVRDLLLALVVPQAVVAQALDMTGCGAFHRACIVQSNARKVNIRQEISDRRGKDKRQSGRTHYKKTLRKFLAFATENGDCEKNPLAGLKVPTPPPAFVYLPDAEDLRRLLKTLKVFWQEPHRIGSGFMNERKKRYYYRHYYALLCLLIDTGCRISEALSVQPEDLTLDSDKPFLCIRQQKGGGTRSLPLNAYTVDALRDYLKVRPKGTRDNPVAPQLFLNVFGDAYTVKEAQKRLRELRTRAGLHPRCTLHSLRHYALTEMAEENLFAAQQMAGHKDSRTTQVYAHKRGEHLREAHTKANPLGKVLGSEGVPVAKGRKHRL